VVDTATAKLLAMAGRVADLTPLMTLTGRHMQTSIRQNFNQGGRPDLWEPLKGLVVLAAGTRRKKGSKARIQGKTRMGGPLVLTGDLRDHIGFTPEPQDLVLWARPENNPIKAFVHQFGTTIAGKNHDITIPPRPYLVFQPEDLDWFRKSADGWIRIGSAGTA
jgi:phage gpG-like protein